MDYLQELNEPQLAAVKCTNGPVMIIAGAGSGKTRVLTYRIAHLIHENIDPFNILALTFTNKAAREMRNRVEELVGLEARNLWIGTFHSVFARILRTEAPKIGYPHNFSIYDTDDSKSLIRTIVKEQQLDEKLYKANIVFNRISSAKNSLVTPKQYQEDLNITSEDESSGRGKIGELYEIYAKRCFQAGAMDFDDLLFKMYQLLEKFPETLYKYQNLFHHILIDEYQDTNHAQYLITRKLADIHQNICVVGDDAQSIYGFRGANIQNIFDFQKDYPELSTFKLEQNYRSTQNILNVANGVIEKNKKQIPKKLWTDNPEGEKLTLRKAASDNDEGRIVADGIMESKLRQHLLNNDIAILYRTNAQSRAFEEALRKQNIDYRVYGGMSFYQRKEIKDLVAYLRLTINHSDEGALRRVINYPTRGIGQTTMQKITVLASEEGRKMWEVMENINRYNISPRTSNAISQFITQIKSYATFLETQNAYDLSFNIAKSSGLLKDLYNDKSVEGLSRFENVEELLNGIKEFTTDDEETGSEDKSLAAYLQGITLLTDADSDDQTLDTVKLMTIHSAKGLEFRHVYIVGLEENLFPSMLSLNSREDLEEERRLLYVAITRAKEAVHFNYATTRYRFGKLTYCEPSRFLDEISMEYLDSKTPKLPARAAISREPERRHFTKFQKSSKPLAADNPNFKPDDVSSLQVGMEVEHMRFGTGKVLQIEGDSRGRIATIFFQEHGQKRIMLNFAKLKMLTKNT